MAEDLLGDTFERAYRARSRFDRRRGTEKAWLYTIALNLLRDRMRSKGAEERAFERTGGTLDANPAADPALESVEERDRVRRALATLSPEEREAIALRFGAELSNPEIARVIGERLTTVEGRIYRALRRLREALV
jgi:RNA polymerase sigma factor (sigma-70 family)